MFRNVPYSRERSPGNIPRGTTLGVWLATHRAVLFVRSRLLIIIGRVLRPLPAPNVTINHSCSKWAVYLYVKYPNAVGRPDDLLTTTVYSYVSQIVQARVYVCRWRDDTIVGERRRICRAKNARRKSAGDFEFWRPKTIVTKQSDFDFGRNITRNAGKSHDISRQYVFYRIIFFSIIEPILILISI